MTEFPKDVLGLILKALQISDPTGKSAVAFALTCTKFKEVYYLTDVPSFHLARLRTAVHQIVAQKGDEWLKPVTQLFDMCTFIVTAPNLPTSTRLAIIQNLQYTLRQKLNRADWETPTRKLIVDALQWPQAKKTADVELSIAEQEHILAFYKRFLANSRFYARSVHHDALMRADFVDDSINWLDLFNWLNHNLTLFVSAFETIITAETRACCDFPKNMRRPYKISKLIFNFFIDNLENTLNSGNIVAYEFKHLQRNVNFEQTWRSGIFMSTFAILIASPVWYKVASSPALFSESTQWYLKSFLHFINAAKLAECASRKLPDGYLWNNLFACGRRRQKNIEPTTENNKENKEVQKLKSE